jgi:hypothetical protein
MERKVGDKVKIKNVLSQSMEDYVPELEEFAGKESIITHVCCDYYRLQIDNGDWCWYDEYFE